MIRRWYEAKDDRKSTFIDLCNVNYIHTDDCVDTYYVYFNFKNNNDRINLAYDDLDRRNEVYEEIKDQLILLTEDDIHI